ncbi:MAG TPA: DNA alkylation repair protein [Pyrinomonadaceae bacterium]
MGLASVKTDLNRLSNAQAAVFLQRFFKTQPGEYGHGDVFRGIRVPVLRSLAKAHQALSVREAQELLKSKFHEDRLLALLILIRHYSKGDDAKKARVYTLYLRHTKFINNWDLVDASAEHIVGPFLWQKDCAELRRLAVSQSLWERRIAIMATFHFIKQGEFRETLSLAKMLLDDNEDLIHKAVGWMLREVGKRDLKVEVAFLKKHYRRMPRTMLRYAIERFPEAVRQQYLRGGI